MDPSQDFVHVTGWSLGRRSGVPIIRDLHSQPDGFEKVSQLSEIYILNPDGFDQTDRVH